MKLLDRSHFNFFEYVKNVNKTYLFQSALRSRTELQILQIFEIS